MLQEDPLKEVREALRGVFNQNSGSGTKDGLFKGIEWQGTVMNYGGRIGSAGIVGVILPKGKLEGSKWLQPVVGQFIEALGKIGLKVNGHGWLESGKFDYYGFEVTKIK